MSGREGGPDQAAPPNHPDEGATQSTGIPAVWAAAHRPCGHRSRWLYLVRCSAGNVHVHYGRGPNGGIRRHSCGGEYLIRPRPVPR